MAPTAILAPNPGARTTATGDTPSMWSYAQRTRVPEISQRDYFSSLYLTPTPKTKNTNKTILLWDFLRLDDRVWDVIPVITGQ